MDKETMPIGTEIKVKHSGATSIIAGTLQPVDVYDLEQRKASGSLKGGLSVEIHGTASDLTIAVIVAMKRYPELRNLLRAAVFMEPNFRIQE